MSGSQTYQRSRSDTEAGRFAVANEPDDRDAATRELEAEDLEIHIKNFIASSEDERERINNPFSGWNPNNVVRAAKKLALYYGAADMTDVFIRAAKVLSMPEPGKWNTLTVPGISAHELQVLRDEKETGFWGQPWPLQTTFFVLFVAAAVQGWNQTGTTGANLGWPRELLYRSTPDDALSGKLNANCAPSGHEKWLFAAVNAIPYLAASIGTFLSDALNEVFFGRRNAIMFSAAIIFASAIGSAFVQNWRSLIGLRALLGIGMGCKAAVVPVFAAEIAPAHLRGTLVMNWQVFDALGIFLGYSANLIVSRTATPWRWQLASSCIPTFALICGVIIVRWDSPRFLVKREEDNRKKHEDLMKLWNASKRGMNDDAVGEENIRKVRQLITTPDWFYVRAPRVLRKHIRPSTTQKYCSPAYKTLLLLRGEPILAAKELIFAHCQLLAEIYTYPLKRNEQQPSELQVIQSSERQVRPRLSWSTIGTHDTDSSVPATTPAPPIYREDVLNPDNTSGPDETSEPGDRVKPQDRVDFSLANRTKWFDRMGHMQNKSMRYLTHEVVAACVVMISQQLCGINVLIFYSATIFSHKDRDTGCTDSASPLWLCWGIGLTNFLFAFPAYRWIETMGRKWLLLATLPLLSILIAAAAASYEAPQGETRQILLAVFVFAFTAVYSFGMGPVPFTYTAEIFPLEHRIIGMSLGVSVNFLGAGILAFFVPIIPTGSILLGIFAGLNILAFIAIWKFVPETIGAAADNETHMTALDLSQLFYIFKRPNSSHRMYMSEVYFGYFWDSIWNILTFQDFKAPEPFYQWNLHLDRRNPSKSS